MTSLARHSSQPRPHWGRRLELYENDLGRSIEWGQIYTCCLARRVPVQKSAGQPLPDASGLSRDQVRQLKRCPAMGNNKTRNNGTNHDKSITSLTKRPFAIELPWYHWCKLRGFLIGGGSVLAGSC